MNEYNEYTPVIDVINNPLFKDYGRFLFPTEKGLPDSSMKLNDIQSLLPFHNQINTDTTLDVLNFLLNEAAAGKKIFYEIYTEEEKAADPTKENTGLLFFRGEAHAPFAVISAGGGFSYVGSIHESFPHALALSRRGYNAFALQYRTGGADVACKDLAAGLSFIFENAEELGIITDDYSLWGGSAGARMAAYLGSYGAAAYGGHLLPQAAAVVMQYTAHSDYSENDPPTYGCVGENDTIVNWKIMEQRIMTLNGLGIDTEFHHYSHLGHGFGLGIGTPAEGWFDDAVAFWEKQMKNLKRPS